MNSKPYFLTALLFVSFPNLAQTQNMNKSSPGYLGRQSTNWNAVSETATKTIEAIIHSMKDKDDVNKDSISGTCSYREASCNGAQITLYKKDNVIFEMTLTSIAGFKIPKLKKNEDYTLKLDWPKHKLTEVKEVRTGEFISITLSDKNQ